MIKAPMCPESLLEMYNLCLDRVNQSAFYQDPPPPRVFPGYIKAGDALFGYKSQN